MPEMNSMLKAHLREEVKAEWETCLSPSETTLFRRFGPGEIIGIGIALSKILGIVDDEKKKEKAMERVRWLEIDYFKKDATAINVLTELVDIFGCDIVKEYVESVKGREEKKNISENLSNLYGLDTRDKKVPVWDSS